MTVQGGDVFVTDKELTPSERERVQMILLKRWLSLKFPRDARLRMDASAPVQSRDAKGRAVGEKKSRRVLRPEMARR